MKRELDEIEAEMGKESMEYKCGFWPSTFGAGVLCGRVILCPMIPRSTCPHRGPIPVEPERVKEDAFPQWHPPCGFQGLCHNGWGSKWCAECPWFDKAPSPGLLQRMGMATWEEEEKDWFVVSKNVGIGTATQLLVRRQDAQEVVTIGTSERRMFRWSDGVQG